MSMSNGVTAGNFVTLVELQASKPRVDTIITLTLLGVRTVYLVEMSDAGGGILLDNGFYANPLISDQEKTNTTEIENAKLNDEIPNEQTGLTYNLLATDRGKTVKRDNAAANTTTAPLDATELIPTNTVMFIIQIGAGVSTIDGESGVTINGVLNGEVTLSAAYKGGSLTKIGVDEYQWLGDGVVE